nr:ATP synthase subunit 8 [Discogaster dentipes]
MPQMAPLPWELLYLFNLVTFFFVGSVLYFMKPEMLKSKMSIKNIKTNQIKWKW